MKGKKQQGLNKVRSTYNMMRFETHFKCKRIHIFIQMNAHGTI